MTDAHGRKIAETETERPAEVDFMRFLNTMRTSLAQSLSGVMLRGSRAVQIGTAEGATAQATNSPGRLVGWSIREAATVPGPALVRLLDGDPANGGKLVACIALTANQSVTKSFNPGPAVVQGLYVQIVSGVVEGSVWLGATD